MSKYIVGFIVGFGISAILVGLALALRVDRWWATEHRRGVAVLGVIVAVTQVLGELVAKIVDNSVAC